MANEQIGTWDFGRILKRDNGVAYEIRKMIKGKRYELVLDVDSENQARAEYALFERDPEGYKAAHKQARRSDPEDGVYLTRDMVESFSRYRAHKRELGEQHILEGISYLARWQEKLKGRDLRRLKLLDLNKVLEGWADPKTGKIKAEKHLIAHIKALYQWLRRTGRVTLHEDPTVDLETPQARAEKLERFKGAQMADIERIYAHTGYQRVRDMLMILCSTGMHLRELVRIVKFKRAVVTEVVGCGEIVATVTYTHKKQRNHTHSLSAPAYAALKRLMEFDMLSLRWSQRMVDRACITLEIKPGVALGAMRHSFITWAKTHGRLVRPTDAGLDMQTIAGIVGHEDERTTRRYYDESKVPPMIKLPIQLSHVDDGKVIDAIAKEEERKERKERREMLEAKAEAA
jgi:integrase